MRVLIDILHPAHVHVFRHVIGRLKEKGHQVLVTARDKDVTLELLDKFGIDYTKISTISSSKVGLGFELIKRTYKLRKIARKFKADVMLGCMGASIALVGKLTGIRTVVLYNNETAGLVNFYADINKNKNKNTIAKNNPI